MIKKGITSYHLKLIALISMLIDHIGVAFFAKLINASYVQTGRDGIVGAMLAFIAQNQEAKIGTHLAQVLHPADDGNVLTCMGKPQLAAVMCSGLHH